MRIHRFHDTTAITPEDGPTFYLTPEQARKLAKALGVFAADIDTLPFHESTLSAKEIS